MMIISLLLINEPCIYIGFAGYLFVRKCIYVKNSIRDNVDDQFRVRIKLRLEMIWDVFRFDR